MKSFRQALSEVRSLETHPLVKKARKAHKDGVWDGNVDKNGNPIVHINGRPHTVVVEGFKELETMFGLREKEWRALVKKHRRELEKYQRTGSISKKVEDELLSWAMNNGEVQNKDDAEEFMDIVLNAHFEPEGEVISEMTQRFAFDNLKKATSAEKSAPRYNLSVDSGVEGKIYYVAVTGKFTDITKWMKTLDEEVELDEMKLRRDGKNIEITKSGPSTKPTFHLKIDGKDHGKFDQEKKAMQYVAKLKEEQELEEATPVARDSKFEVMKHPSGLYSINFVNVRNGDIFIGKEDLVRFKAFMSKVKV